MASVVHKYNTSCMSCQTRARAYRLSDRQARTGNAGYGTTSAIQAHTLQQYKGEKLVEFVKKRERTLRNPCRKEWDGVMSHRVRNGPICQVPVPVLA
jgi:hypothetical protein